MTDGAQHEPASGRRLRRVRACFVHFFFFLDVLIVLIVRWPITTMITSCVIHMEIFYLDQLMFVSSTLI